MLEQALLDEPENDRYRFYLAQSYRDAGELELAIKHYRNASRWAGGSRRSGMRSTRSRS